MLNLFRKLCEQRMMYCFKQMNIYGGWLMNRLLIISSIILTITIGVFILYQINVSLPDWLVRLNDAIMLISLIFTVFFKTKSSKEKK